MARRTKNLESLAADFSHRKSEDGIWRGHKVKALYEAVLTGVVRTLLNYEWALAGNEILGTPEAALSIGAINNLRLSVVHNLIVDQERTTGQRMTVSVPAWRAIEGMTQDQPNFWGYAHMAAQDLFPEMEKETSLNKLAAHAFLSGELEELIKGHGYQPNEVDTRFGPGTAAQLDVIRAERAVTPIDRALRALLRHTNFVKAIDQIELSVGLSDILKELNVASLGEASFVMESEIRSWVGGQRAWKELSGVLVRSGFDTYAVRQAGVTQQAVHQAVAEHWLKRHGRSETSIMPEAGQKRRPTTARRRKPPTNDQG